MRDPYKQKFPILADIADVPVPKERKIERIYIHCSDSLTGDAEQINEWHNARSWSGIGYNYVVLGRAGKDTGFHPGLIQLGRKVEKTPAQVRSDNEGTLGICIIGNFEGESPLDRTIDNPAVRLQMNSVLILCAELTIRLSLPIRQIIGHREVNLIPGKEPTSKTCPGKAFDMDEFRAMVYYIRELDYTHSYAKYGRLVESFLRHFKNRRYKFHGGRDVVKCMLDNRK